MTTSQNSQRQSNGRMTDVDQLVDELLAYEETYNPAHQSRRARRKQKPRVNPAGHKPDHHREATQLADELDQAEQGFQLTYVPARHEEMFLIDSIQSFFTQHLISDVVAAVKGGKEASVYRCRATPQTGVTWLAAKVYRPRIFRTVRNDAQYRQSRPTLTADGRAVKNNDHRIMRALGKKSSFGVQVAHTSWLMYEFTTLQRLYQAGAAVPRPVDVAENAILMAYIGDEQIAAPALNEVRLSSEEAPRLFAEVLRNVEILLEFNLIHSDLSPYNILYWQGNITLIDFPQVTNLHKAGGGINNDARFLLERDIRRICDYFRRQGVRSNPAEILDTFWNRYAYQNPDDVLADISRQAGGEADYE